MPAERRISDLTSFRYTPAKRAHPKPYQQRATSELLPPNGDCDPSLQEATDFSKCDIYYPLTPSERDAFRTEAGKRVPSHHWAVYDLIREIPAGKVSTYKGVSSVLGSGSPRSVGGALRNNPFAPRIPCHRVIASSLFVGGFKGEWSSSSHSDGDASAKVGGRNWHRAFRGGGMGPLQNEKLRMLVCEGVRFGRDGQLSVSQDAVWKFGQDADG
ncbi:6-O-methylguanine DNA methyltransferase [Lactarius akahatsu]|uniref:Methylated-DNA--protein-cysteine methyltransferase n=1 Tax=Lactarius akahatsu TaxID=416441 RepID=A0AAD4L7X9_9AGAM|nr:6-O-methylguanine DNA methyltransferase [Lactarius akahatsu]